jgi:formylglycine-generating enzyme required for sulfatase activity
MVVIPADSFMMGSGERANEHPVHGVTVKVFAWANTKLPKVVEDHHGQQSEHIQRLWRQFPGGGGELVQRAEVH